MPVGPLPLIFLLVGGYFYCRGLILRRNDRPTNVFSTFGSGVFIAAFSFYVITPASALTLFLAQITFVILLGLMLKLAFERSPEQGPFLYIPPKDRRKELYGWSIISPFFLFAMDYFPFVVNETRCNYRCVVLNFLIGRDENFQLFYIACLCGFSCIALPLVVAVQLLRRQSLQ